MVAGFDHPLLVETAIEQYKKFSGYHSLFGRLSDKTLELSDKLIEVSPLKKGLTAVLVPNLVFFIVS